MNVATILTDKGRNVATARPDTPLLEIARKLAAKKIGAIVIVGEAGAVAGIVSERDIIRTIGTLGEDALKMPVADVMTKNVQTCQETSTIDELMDLMTRGRFRHMPVIEDGGLVGIISIGDIVKNHVAEVQMEVTAMRCYLATG